MLADPTFPYLSEDDYFEFDVSLAEIDGFVSVGGNLSPGMLLSAYKQGVFPWPDGLGSYLPWFYLTPRCVLYLDDIHVSKSLKKQIKKNSYTFKIDTNFKKVMELCGSTRGSETWVCEEMVDAYVNLHELGYAHSFEVYSNDDKLIAGLYGIASGNIFCGESMFTLESNCSKIALLFLCNFLKKMDFEFIDCQQVTDHLISMGACQLSKSDYEKALRKNSKVPDRKELWINKSNKLIF